MASASQHARQLDKTIVNVCGEINIDSSFGSLTLNLTALVVESMDSDILAGVPFCMSNQIEFSFSKQEIYIQGKTIGNGTQPSSHVKCVKTVLDNTTSTLPYSVNLQKLDLPPSPFKYKEEVEIQPGLDYNDTRSDPDPVICSMVVSNSPEVVKSVQLLHIHRI